MLPTESQIGGLMKSILMAAALAVTSSYSTIALAQVEAAPLTSYGELPATENVALSANGSVAMVTTVNGERMVLVLGPDMKPVNAARIGDIKVRDIDWVGNEAVAITRTDTRELGERYVAESGEFANVMIVPISNAQPVQTIFNDDRSMLKTTYGIFGYRKIDGEWFGFFGGAKMERNQAGNYAYHGSPPALYRVRLSDNKSVQISQTPERFVSYDWLLDTQGEIAAERRREYSTGNWKIRNSRGKTIAEGNVGEKGAVSMPGYSTTPGNILFYTREGEDGDFEYFEVPTDGSSPPQRIFEGLDIYSIRLDPDTSQIIAYRLEGERRDQPGDWVFFDESAQEEADKIYAGFANVNGKISTFSPGFGKAVVRTNGNSDSGTWLLIDTVNKSASVLAKSYPQIKPFQVGPISVFEYKAQDGLELDGILTLPPGIDAKNLPVIMLPHGGPRSHDTPSFDWWAQAFASRGYAVFQPNFRGSTNRDEDFIDAGNAEWGKKMQSDISDGMMALAEKGIVDPDRACIMGASYGGYAAMAGITLQQGVYKCSVAVAGVSDLKKMVKREQRETSSKFLMEFREETIGPVEEMDSISPRTFAAKADAPILLVHGRDDTVVPYEQSEMMAKALESAGRPYEFVELKGEDHWLSRSTTRHQMLDAAMKFVMKHNPPD